MPQLVAPPRRNGGRILEPRTLPEEALRISAPRPFDFSAHRYTTEDLNAAQHPHELTPRPFIAVNLDAALMGVGGDDSWTACVHDEFLITPPVAEPFEWEITLQPEEDVGEDDDAPGADAGDGVGLDVDAGDGP